MAKKKAGLRSATQAVNGAGANITSARTLWKHQLKQREDELRQLKFHLGNAVTEARKKELCAKIMEKQRVIDDVQDRLARCKKPGKRSTGYINISGGGRADGND